MTMSATDCDPRLGNTVLPIVRLAVREVAVKYISPLLSRAML